jgi:tetratricopeptide (TPR) repeat protein
VAALVPTLRSLLAQADAVFAEGRTPQARRAYEDLVQRAQEKPDRATEGMARAMLARCLLLLEGADAARVQLDLAERTVASGDVEARARFLSARVRLQLEEGPPAAARTALREYLAFAEDERRGHEILDACLLLSAGAPPKDRAEWLDRGISQAVELGADALLGRACGELAHALDQLEQGEAALEAYQQSLRWHRHRGRGRESVAAGWAVGALACRLEEWPLARSALEEAVAVGERLTDCEDLVAWALADLASVYEAAGDVIEARRILLRALARGREQQLGAQWPDRWDAMRRHARRLELE